MSKDGVQILRILTSLTLPDYYLEGLDEEIPVQKHGGVSIHELLALALIYFREFATKESVDELLLIADGKEQIAFPPDGYCVGSVVRHLNAFLQIETPPNHTIHLYFSSNKYVRIGEESLNPGQKPETILAKELNDFVRIWSELENGETVSLSTFLTPAKLQILSLRNRHLFNELSKTPKVGHVSIQVKDLVEKTTDIQVNLQAEQGGGLLKGLDNWKSVFEATYKELNNSLGEKDLFHGWQSTSTGKPIPASAMEEWLQTTMDKILISKPTSVLELGAGSGLIVSRLIEQPYCKRYLASDLSSHAIQFLESRSRENPSWGSKLELEMGDSLGVLQGCIARGDQFDTIILNSVVQYFPNAEYLTQVLDFGFQILSPGGRFFIGDIRNVDWVDYYHLDLEIQKVAGKELDLKQVLASVQNKRDTVFELLLGPRFFEEYEERNKSIISHFYTEIHGGEELNELTCYRYNVSLFKANGDESVGLAKQALPRRIDWLDIGNLEAVLNSQTSDQVLLSGVSNPRLLLEAGILDDQTQTTDEQVKRELIHKGKQKLYSEFVSLKILHETGKRYGYSSRIMISTKAKHLLDVFYFILSEGKGDNVLPTPDTKAGGAKFTEPDFTTCNYPSRNKERVLAKTILVLQVKKLLRGSLLPLPELSVL